MEKIFSISENGFSMDGKKTVATPECRIKATGYLDAVEKLNKFLKTKELTDDIELITPIERIDFDFHNQ